MLPRFGEEYKSGSNGSHLCSMYDIKTPKKGKSWAGLAGTAGFGCEVH